MKGVGVGGGWGWGISINLKKLHPKIGGRRFIDMLFWKRHHPMNFHAWDKNYILRLTFHRDLFLRDTISQHWYQSLHWRHNGYDGVSNHQPHDCLLNRLFRRRSKKTWKLRVTGLCVGNSPVTGEFPAQRASNAEKVSIWWRHHIMTSPQKATEHYLEPMLFKKSDPWRQLLRVNNTYL